MVIFVTSIYNGGVMSNQQFIVYQSHWEDPEIIVTTPEAESEMIRMYFTESDRDIEKYDRSVYNELCIPVRVAGLRIC